MPTKLKILKDLFDLVNLQQNSINKKITGGGGDCIEQMAEMRRKKRGKEKDASRAKYYLKQEDCFQKSSSSKKINMLI